VNEDDFLKEWKAHWEDAEELHYADKLSSEDDMIVDKILLAQNELSERVGMYSSIHEYLKDKE
jgi:hypothetical protein